VVQVLGGFELIFLYPAIEKKIVIKQLCDAIKKEAEQLSPKTNRSNNRIKKRVLVRNTS